MLLFLIILCLHGMQPDYDRVSKKVDELGSASRKSLLLKKVDAAMTLTKADDTLSIYNLKVKEGITLQLFQYAGIKADILKLNDCKISVGLQANPLVDPDMNPHYLSSNSIRAYELKYRGNYYLIVLANAAGASGKAINNTLFYLFNLTHGRESSVVSATSIYGTIANVADVNQDGLIDIFLVRELKDKYSIQSFNVSPTKAVKIKDTKQIIL